MEACLYIYNICDFLFRWSKSTSPSVAPSTPRNSSPIFARTLSVSSLSVPPASPSTPKNTAPKKPTVSSKSNTHTMQHSQGDQRCPLLLPSHGQRTWQLLRGNGRSKSPQKQGAGSSSKTHPVSQDQDADYRGALLLRFREGSQQVNPLL